VRAIVFEVTRLGGKQVRKRELRRESENACHGQKKDWTLFAVISVRHEMIDPCRRNVDSDWFNVKLGICKCVALAVWNTNQNRASHCGSHYYFQVVPSMGRVRTTVVEGGESVPVERSKQGWRPLYEYEGLRLTTQQSLN